MVCATGGTEDRPRSIGFSSQWQDAVRARARSRARVALRLTALSLSLLVAVLVTPRREVRCQMPSCGWGLSPSTSGQHNRGHFARPVSADPSGQPLCGPSALESP